MSDAVTAINVSGARWFDSLNGNTYHSARVYVERESGADEVYCVPWTYGYDRQYEESAAEVLERAGVIERDIVSEQFGAQTLGRHCADHGITFTSTVRDGLKRDMVRWGRADA